MSHPQAGDPSDPGLDDSESPTARLNRNIAELLQELRVAQTGVQILFAFLLGQVFTAIFAQQPLYVHWLHLITVLLAASSTAFLIAPAAWHRVLFQQHRRVALLKHGNQFAKIGVGLLAMTMALSVALVAFVAIGPTVAVVCGVVSAVGFFSLWFLYPKSFRRDETE